MSKREGARLLNPIHRDLFQAIDEGKWLTIEYVRARDRKKQEICCAHEMELIRVDNSYARRYQHIKWILEAYFKAAR